MKKENNYIVCCHNDSLNEIPIKNEYFLLVVLLSGKLFFSMENSSFLAEAPCCVCFDESENLKARETSDAEYFSIYFHPKVLNVNMTFDFLRNCLFDDISLIHEIFLLTPFLEKCLKEPLSGEAFPEIKKLCISLYEEMMLERDAYWNYRCRTWFLEILIALERMADIPKKMSSTEAAAGFLFDKRIRAAVVYIEEHYAEKIELKDVAASCGLNPTTLTESFKRNLDMTVTKYITYCRIKNARKLLRTTELSIKEIAVNCGFRTEAHFCRIFKEWQKETPGGFRRRKIEKERKRGNR